MEELSSPILIYGDRFISQNHINTIKSKYNKFYDINVISAIESTLEYIEAISTSQGFIPQSKITIINDLPNQKAVREFIIELTSRKNIPYTKFIVWDSSESIKLDPKTKLPNKTWEDFIAKFKCIEGSKIVNCGAEFTEKDDNEITSFIKTRFSKQNKEINSDAIKAFINIVGRDRGMITSEIDKLALAAPIKITSEFIIENAFPSSKEAILFKLNNALDGTYSESIELLEQFLESGINDFGFICRVPL